MGSFSISNERKAKLQRDAFDGVIDLRVGTDLSSTELLLLAAEWFGSAESILGPLGRYNSARVLRDLTKPGGIGLWEATSDHEAPISLRTSVIEATVALYGQLFNPLCEPRLVHLSQTRDPLNICCFLWWEDFPGSSALPERERQPLRSAATRAMKEIWERSDNVACRESAIHGLGDWVAEWGDSASQLLEKFSIDDHSPELREYARRMIGFARRSGPTSAPTLH